MDFHDRIVLIIDDEEAYRIMFRQIVTEKLKAKARLANNPLQAFELFREYVPDLVILDMQMPHMDGLTALNTIRSDERLRHMPVIAATALRDPILVQLIAERGISDFILKPFQASVAAEKIQAVLEKLPPKSIQAASGSYQL